MGKYMLIMWSKEKLKMKLCGLYFEWNFFVNILLKFMKIKW